MRNANRTIANSARNSDYPFAADVVDAGKRNRVELQPISSRSVVDIVLNLALTIVQKNSDRPLSIAEIGAGNGAFARALNERLDLLGLQYHYDCFDIEPEQINSQHIGIICRHIDAQRSFGLTREYDLIIAVELIEHLESPFHFLREVAGICKAGGTLLVTTPNVLSLRSRWRHFMSGCDDYFRRPYNEHWLNMGHVNPINPIQLNYIARKNGFQITSVRTNRYTAGSILLAPLVPFLYLYSYVHFVLRERGSGQRSRNRDLLSSLFRPTMLFGKIAILEMRKEKTGPATPDMWHRPDRRFPP